MSETDHHIFSHIEQNGTRSLQEQRKQVNVMYADNARTQRNINTEIHKSERRIIRNRVRRQQEIKKHLSMFLVTACLIAVCSFTLSAFRSNAKNDIGVFDKYYKSIQISNHDTLWSIAEQYMDDTHYDSIQDYISEVRQMNSMEGDCIRYGEYLIIPYYDDTRCE